MSLQVIPVYFYGSSGWGCTYEGIIKAATQDRGIPNNELTILLPQPINQVQLGQETLYIGFYLYLMSGQRYSYINLSTLVSQ